MRIDFDTAVAAFGFYGVDIGDFSGQVTVTTVNGGTNVYNVGNTVNGPGGSVLFWGVIDMVSWGPARRENRQFKL